MYKDFINCEERLKEIVYILFDILFSNRRCWCSYIVTLHFNWIFYLSYHLHKNVSPDSSVLCLHEMLGSDRVLQLLRLAFGVWSFSRRSILSIQFPVLQSIPVASEPSLVFVANLCIVEISIVCCFKLWYVSIPLCIKLLCICDWFYLLYMLSFAKYINLITIHCFELFKPTYVFYLGT